MELQIQHQELAPIQANLDQIKEYVLGVVDKYQNASYTDEQMKLAKADRAELRHLKEDIDTKRKQVKAAWNAPYLAFETKIKEITALIDEPVALIDGQIKEWEERRKAERRNKLEGVFNQHNPFGALLPFENVLEPEMLKMSITDSKATTLLACKMEKVAEEMAQLESVVDPQFRTECVAVYTQTLNLAQAILRANTLKAEKAKQEAVLGAVEQEPLNAPAQPLQEAQDEVEDIFADMPMADPAQRPETRRFIITGTPAQVNELKRLAAGIGLKMREVF